MSLTRKYLHDLLIEVGLLERFTETGKAAFLQDERTQYAVMMAYTRIGEIVKRIPDDLLNQYPEAEWRNLKGFRDVLAHRYDEILPERVWDAVEKLPTLRASVEALLANLPEDEEEPDTDED
jgi:uncharacterized protein with HEPN domain